MSKPVLSPPRRLCATDGCGNITRSWQEHVHCGDCSRRDREEASAVADEARGLRRGRREEAPGLPSVSSPAETLPIEYGDFPPGF